MRKRMIGHDVQEASPTEQLWLEVDRLALVEITSEDADHPFESALLPGIGTGWQAAGPGSRRSACCLTRRCG